MKTDALTGQRLSMLRGLALAGIITLGVAACGSSGGAHNGASSVATATAAGSTSPGADSSAAPGTGSGTGPTVGSGHTTPTPVVLGNGGPRPSAPPCVERDHPGATPTPGDPTPVTGPGEPGKDSLSARVNYMRWGGCVMKVGKQYDVRVDGIFNLYSQAKGWLEIDIFENSNQTPVIPSGGPCTTPGDQFGVDIPYTPGPSVRTITEQSFLRTEQGGKILAMSFPQTFHVAP